MWDKRYDNLHAVICALFSDHCIEICQDFLETFKQKLKKS